MVSQTEEILGGERSGWEGRVGWRAEGIGGSCQEKLVVSRGFLQRFNRAAHNTNWNERIR